VDSRGVVLAASPAALRGPIGRVLGRPTLILLVVTTIPLAPLFNAFGRVAAWADLPAGIGGMWFAAHPLKFLNVFLPGAMAVAMIRRRRGAGTPG
jgi:hypothetical protein